MIMSVVLTRRGLAGLVAVALVIVVYSISVLSFNDGFRTVRNFWSQNLRGYAGGSRPSQIAVHPSDFPFAQAIRTIWAPLMIKPDAPSFFTQGEEWKIYPNPEWTKGIGQKLCIVDIDTRPSNGDNEAWSTKDSPYESWATSAPGHVNHYLYAMIHGYDYKYFHTQNQPDTNPAWGRIPVLHTLLSDDTYDFVIYTDGDVVFPHLHLPFEWLMNRWNITDKASVTMALDVDWEQLHDSTGRQATNAGFQIWSRSPTSTEMLARWARCYEGTRYPGCEKLKNEWPAEQAAFAEYIRHEFEDAVNEVPCTEAMQYPGARENCNGTFIRHYTDIKDQAKVGFGESVLNDVMRAVREDMVSHADTTYVEAPNIPAPQPQAETPKEPEEAQVAKVPETVEKPETAEAPESPKAPETPKEQTEAPKEQTETPKEQTKTRKEQTETRKEQTETPKEQTPETAQTPETKDAHAKDERAGVVDDKL